MEKEIWKDIPWYEWLYQVSNKWNVKSLFLNRWFLLKYKNPHKKWAYVSLSKNGSPKTILVSRLVASMFLWLDISNRKMCVCHIDDDPTNNNVTNLFLWTQQENMDDKVLKKRQYRPKWEKHPNCKLKESDVIEIRNKLILWFSNIRIAKIYWVSQPTICDIKKRRSWKTLT